MKPYLKSLAPVLLPGLFLSLCTGCLTTTSAQQRNRDMIHMQENIRLLDEDNRRLAGRVETLELELQRVTSDSDRLKNRVDDSVRTGTKNLETRLADLERQVAQLAQQREQDKKEIVDSLSQKIAKLMQQDGGASKAPAGQKKSTRSEYGYEHEVKAGETLSEIATAYGVSVSVIIRENALKDPNHLRAGQKLFIPE